MEIINILADVVNNVGFPIVAFGVVGYLFIREQDMHKEENTSFTEAINNLTIALTKLSDSLEGGEE